MAQALIVIDIQEGLVKENPFDTKNFIIENCNNKLNITS